MRLLPARVKGSTAAVADGPRTSPPVRIEQLLRFRLASDVEQPDELGRAPGRSVSTAHAPSLPRTLAGGRPPWGAGKMVAWRTGLHRSGPYARGRRRVRPAAGSRHPSARPRPGRTPGPCHHPPHPRGRRHPHPVSGACPDPAAQGGGSVVRTVRGGPPGVGAAGQCGPSGPPGMSPRGRRSAGPRHVQAGRRRGHPHGDREVPAAIVYEPGSRRRRPDKLHADKGYDYNHFAAMAPLARDHPPHRPQRYRVLRTPGRRHRRTVERTTAWLAGCRRLHRRHERKADHFLAFASIAYTLICYAGSPASRNAVIRWRARKGTPTLVPVAEPKYRIRALQTDSTVVVYQAYAPEIGLPAAREGRFPATWQRNRMTWIKPSFL
ncbi:protein of unknown function [Actinacidiphila paucisporea]|uniref:Transposase DDE domain-containing protein n=1 Tax=Actinacidiphila paucisporea TaxID=310782 RepID=A0A1M7QXE8_9ACTN|nr:protein of unknown function [Actinacidiphila paucisporea]